MQAPKLPDVHLRASLKNLGWIATALKFGVIAAAIVAVYYQDLNIIFNDALHDEASFHILAIPFLFGYLVYRKRNMIVATVTHGRSAAVGQKGYFQTLIGVLLCTIAVILYWYGSYTFTPIDYHMPTLPLFAAGLILILFNFQTLRQMAFPIAFLIFLTPPPSEILYSIGSTLSVASAQASNAIVNAFRMSSVISSQYGTPVIMLTRPDHSVMNFNVDIACSGVYSLLGFAIFAVFIAFITRGKLRNKLAVMVMGIPLIIALNITRITTILTIGYYYGDQLALQVFHLVGATVLMFIGTLILLGITEKMFKITVSPDPCPTCNPNPSGAKGDSCPNCGKLLKTPRVKLRRNDLARILAIAIAVTFLLTIQAPVFALTQGPAQVVIQTPTGEQGNTMILPQIPGYNLTYVYRDSSFEQLSGEDASLVYAYAPDNQSLSTVWVAVEVAQAQSELHRWETCLVTFPLSQGYQPKISQIDLRDIQTLANPPITARYFAFQYVNTNQTQLVLYWYETSTFNINGTSQQKNVKMSLVAYPKSSQYVAAFEAQLLPFAIAINNYWQPIKTWTQVALAISQNGLFLSIITAGLLVVILFYQMSFNMQERLSLLKLYGKLSAQDRLLIRSVGEASRTGDSTTTGIANRLQEFTKAPVAVDQLAGKLEEVAQAGLIRKVIASKADVPTVAWKSRMPHQFRLFGLHVS